MVSPSVSSPEDEDSEELIKKAHQKSVKRRVRIGAVIGILILATVGGFISVSYTHLTLPTTPYV